MRLLLILLFVFIIANCGTGQKQPEQEVEQVQLILINATGLTRPVTLLETVTNTSFQIVEDGSHTIKLSDNQGIYQLEIVDSQQQYCSLDDSLQLDCNIVCTADYSPVCAKEPNAGVVCVTTPCDTDKYMTFSNACHASGANAWIAMETECLGLEDVLSEHIEPVFITNIAIIDIYSDNFKIVNSVINDDTLTILFEVSGGCGSHELDLLVSDSFLESSPVQLANVIAYKNNDNCDSIITVEKTFDLEPIQELYRRNYPQQAGVQSVDLPGLGLYSFTPQFP